MPANKPNPPFSSVEEKFVIAAIAEYDERGPEKFLAAYQKGPATKFEIYYDGTYYASKAILWAAYKKQYPGVEWKLLSGGPMTPHPLVKLKFTVIDRTTGARVTIGPPEKASDFQKKRVLLGPRGIGCE